MAKKKNYTKLFLALCKKHEIWFSVCADGSIDQVTYLKDNNNIDIFSDKCLYLGRKACYDWLVREIKDLDKE